MNGARSGARRGGPWNEELEYGERCRFEVRKTASRALGKELAGVPTSTRPSRTDVAPQLARINLNAMEVAAAAAAPTPPTLGAILPWGVVIGLLCRLVSMCLQAVAC